MCVVVTTTFCCIWGPGLALRGPDGIRSVHTAVDSLKSEHGYIFAFFFLGLIAFYLSNLLLVWCYFEEWIAVSSSLLLIFFLLLIFYYTISLLYKLRVTEEEAVEGRIEALQAYENIADLDQVYTSSVPFHLPPGPSLLPYPGDLAIEGTSLRPQPRHVLLPSATPSNLQEGPSVDLLASRRRPSPSGGVHMIGEEGEERRRASEEPSWHAPSSSSAVLPASSGEASSIGGRP
ncbi:transmembrane protein, partial [Cystoisospora suis]